MKKLFYQPVASLLLACILLFSLSACQDAELIDQVTNAQKNAEFNAPDAISELPDISGNDGRFTLPISLNDTLNPYTCITETNRIIMPLLYDGLFSLDESYNWEYMLCESFEANDSHTMFRFTLREAFFPDGSQLTAYDAAYSINQARNSDSRFSSRLSSIIACYVVDGQLCIETGTSSPRLPAVLDLPICKENNPLMGCGAYVLSGSGSDRQLNYNETWWRGIKYPLDTIYLFAYDSASDLISAFISKQIDLVTTDFNSTSALEFSGEYDIWDVNSTTMLYVAFNMEQPIFTIAASRQIIALGIDRDTIASDIYSGFATATSLPFPSCSQYYQAEQDAINQYSIAQLRQVMLDNEYGDLNENGYPDVETYYGWFDLNVDLLVNSESEEKVQTAHLIHDTFAELGIEVTVKALPYDEYLERIQTGDFYMYLGEVTLSPDFNLYKLMGMNGAMNYGHYSSQEANALLSEDYGTDFLAMFQQSLPFTPILFKTTSVLVQRGVAGGLTPLQDNIFYQFENWTFG